MKRGSRLRRSRSCAPRGRPRSRSRPSHSRAASPRRRSTAGMTTAPRCCAQSSTRQRPRRRCPRASRHTGCCAGSSAMPARASRKSSAAAPSPRCSSTTTPSSRPCYSAWCARSQPLREELHERIATGELREGLDVELLISMLLGTFMAEAIRGREAGETWADDVLSLVWPAVTSTPAP